MGNTRSTSRAALALALALVALAAALLACAAMPPAAQAAKAQSIKIASATRAVSADAVAEQPKTYTFKVRGAKTALEAYYKAGVLGGNQAKGLSSVKVVGKKRLKVTVKANALPGTYKVKVRARKAGAYKASAYRTATVKVKASYAATTSEKAPDGSISYTADGRSAKVSKASSKPVSLTVTAGTKKMTLAAAKTSWTQMEWAAGWGDADDAELSAAGLGGGVPERLETLLAAHWSGAVSVSGVDSGDVSWELAGTKGDFDEGDASVTYSLTASADGMQATLSLTETLPAGQSREFGVWLDRHETEVAYEADVRSAASSDGFAWRGPNMLKDDGDGDDPFPAIKLSVKNGVVEVDDSNDYGYGKAADGYSYELYSQLSGSIMGSARRSTGVHLYNMSDEYYLDPFTGELFTESISMCGDYYSSLDEDTSHLNEQTAYVAAMAGHYLAGETMTRSELKTARSTETVPAVVWLTDAYTACDASTADASWWHETVNAHAVLMDDVLGYDWVGEMKLEDVILSISDKGEVQLTGRSTVIY